MSSSDVSPESDVVSVTVPLELFNSAIGALMKQPASEVFDVLYALKVQAVPNFAEQDSGGE